ncbi:MAG: Gfo/Idh/MocA family oxidoreductase [Verrucomicrobiota bacterium]
MSEENLGIILNGVTGRMGTNQHLIRSILAIRDQGGVTLPDGTRIQVDPILTGRSEAKLKALAESHSVHRYSTDLATALADPHNQIFFDASSTLYRPKFIEQAAKAGKAIYCEKPVATTSAEASRLAKLCAEAGVKNGAVQDKLWLPGLLKVKQLIEENFFGEILSVRGEFGYWVFTGHDPEHPPQRPSWNYRREDGGGIIVDMLCHWRYVIDNLFGDIKSLSCLGATHIPERIAEDGHPYPCTADDACYATFELENGIICQFNSSWDVRVRRDDLFTMQIDGTLGSAVAGLRECRTQSLENTPTPVWNPDVPQPLDFYDNWERLPDPPGTDNAFKIQWEKFVRHVVANEPFPWNLEEAAKGVQLAEAALQSWRERRWIDLPPLL